MIDDVKIDMTSSFNAIVERSQIPIENSCALWKD